jgi:predicted RNase H-like nuclease (RuvC/YqgF family)
MAYYQYFVSVKEDLRLANLMTVVRKEIDRLRKDIAKHTAELDDLTKELASHEKIAEMLGDGSAPRKPAQPSKPRKKETKSSGRTNWNALLDSLPRSFTAAQVKDAAGEASNQADVHQALLRWRKAGRVTTRQRGKYRKAQASGNA